MDSVVPSSDLSIPVVTSVLTYLLLLACPVVSDMSGHHGMASLSLQKHQSAPAPRILGVKSLPSWHARVHERRRTVEGT